MSMGSGLVACNRSSYRIMSLVTHHNLWRFSRCGGNRWNTSQVVVSDAYPPLRSEHPVTGDMVMVASDTNTAQSSLSVTAAIPRSLQQFPKLLPWAWFPPIAKLPGVSLFAVMNCVLTVAFAVKGTEVWWHGDHWVGKSDH